MKRFCQSFALLLIGLSSLGFAQTLERIVVLPFNAAQSAEVYRYALATGLQRSLNVIDGVYVPPVGDALLLSQRLNDQDVLSPEAVAEAFDASAVVSGLVLSESGEARVSIGLRGPELSKDVLATGPIDEPKAVLRAVADTVIRELGLRVSAEDRSQLNRVIAQTPESVESLRAVAEAASRLPQVDTAALLSAAERSSDSSWALSEAARAQALSGDMGSALDNSLRAVQLESADVEARVIRAIVLLSAGQRAEAQAAFDATLELNPVHALALAGRAETTDNPAADLEKALASYPRLGSAYIALAEVQGQTNPQRALQTLRRGASAAPDLLGLHRAVVREVLGLGDPRSALNYLQQVTGDPAARSAALYSLAVALPGPDYDEAALGLIRRGRAEFPTSSSLVLAEAEILERSGKQDAAEQVLSEALSQNPQSLNLINALGLLQARAGKLAEAQATLERAPGSVDLVQFNLAQVYLQSGRTEAALQVLETLLPRNPDDADMYAYYGAALGRAGRIDQAKNALEQALELEPDNDVARRALQVIEQQLRLTKGRVVELEPEASGAFAEGLSAIERNDLAAAREAFERARSADDNGLIAFYQGYIYQLGGDTRRALSAYERAAQDFPDSDTVLNNIGYGHLQLGRYDKALDYLNRAREANPENPEVHLNLGLTLYGLARFEQALRSWEQAVELEPSLAPELERLMDDARARLP